MTSEAQTQAHARFRSDAGTADAAPTWYANEDTNYTADLSGGNLTLRVRFSVQENSVASTSTNWILRLSKNGGAYGAVTTATSSVKSIDAGSSADETAITTRRLTAGSGSFINGLYDETGSTGALQITANNHTEFEYGIQLVAADVAHNDTLDFRVYRNTTAFTTYSVTPRITVSKPVAVSATLTGIAGTGSPGTITVTGLSNVSITGIAGTGSPGTITVTGQASTNVTGIFGTGSPGSLGVREPYQPDYAGISSAPIASFPIAGSRYGDPGFSNPTGVSGTGFSGTPTVTGIGNVTLTGIAGTGNIGTATVAAKANTNVTGVSGTGSPGTVTVTGFANVPLTGVNGTGFAGNLTVSGKAFVTPTGVSGSGAAGTVVATGQAVITLTGVSATGTPGSVTVTGTAVVTLPGAQGSGAVGTITVDVAGNVNVFIPGVQGTGLAGTVDVTAVINATENFLPFLVTVGQMKSF